MSNKVAVVTGSNKGIGYGIVKGLCESMNGIVYMTARNVDNGNEAMEKLRCELSPQNAEKLRFHQLDITDSSSIDRLKTHLANTHDGVDIIVNNAGIAFRRDDTTPDGIQAEMTLKTNYFGTKAMCEAVIPIMRKNGRIVNVASQMGLLRQIKDDALKRRLVAPDLTLEELDQIMNNYTEAAKENKRAERGLPANSYGMSKLGEIAMTRIFQRMLDSMGRADVVVNACCPGYVKTDMSSHKGTRTIEEGAKTPVYLALHDAAQLPRGKMLLDCVEINWETGHPENIA